MGGGGGYLGREGNGLGGLMGKEVVGGRVAGGEGVVRWEGTVDREGS